MTRSLKFLFYPSSLSLILVNLVPIFGVVFWSWDAFSVIFLYWSETAIIGFFNVLKIKKISKKPLSPYLVFFIVQYILFLFVYLFLITQIFKPNLESSTEYLEALGIVFKYLYTLLISFLFIFISHGLSFQYNFINKKEFLHADERKQILAPYKRIFVMHILILLAGHGIVYYGQDKTFSAVIWLVLIKIVLDLIFHTIEHNKKIIKTTNLHRG